MKRGGESVRSEVSPLYEEWCGGGGALGLKRGRERVRGAVFIYFAAGCGIMGAR